MKYNSNVGIESSMRFSKGFVEVVCNFANNEIPKTLMRFQVDGTCINVLTTIFNGKYFDSIVRDVL